MAAKSQTALTKSHDPAEWVDRFGDALFRFAVVRLARRDDAEDAVQEALLAAWKARHTFDGRSSLETWLVGILRRKISDFYRRVGKEPASETSLFTANGSWAAPVAPWREAPEQLAENAEFWSVVARCLGGLPPHFGEAFRRRDLQRQSVDEACQELEITPQNLAVRLHRARALVRQCLQHKWFAPDDQS